MLDQARFYTALGQLPQLLDPEPVGLRGATFGEPEVPDQNLGQAAATTFRDHRCFCADLRARGEVRSRGAVLLETHVADADTADRSGRVEERGRGREAGEYVATERLGLAGQPRCQIAERDDEVAVVRHLRWRRQPVAPGSSQQRELVARGRNLDAGVLGAPFRQQRIERSRLEHAAGQRMRAHRGRLLQQADREVRLLLLEPDGAGKTGGTAADDDDVVLHDVAFDISSIVFRHGHSP